MQIREEAPSEAAMIAEVTEAAFLNAPHRDGTEAALVAALRDQGALILSLVALGEDGVIGHIGVSPCRVGGVETALIAPVSVLPRAQAAGVGSALIHSALARLNAGGWRGVALVGDPDFYGRFGFQAREGLTCPGVPSENVLSRGLDLNPAPLGELILHPAFSAL